MPIAIEHKLVIARELEAVAALERTMVDIAARGDEHEKSMRFMAQATEEFLFAQKPNIIDETEEMKAYWKQPDRNIINDIGRPIDRAEKMLRHGGHEAIVASMTTRSHLASVTETLRRIKAGEVSGPNTKVQLLTR